jgi:hypothetical protein
VLMTCEPMAGRADVFVPGALILLFVWSLVVGNT